MKFFKLIVGFVLILAFVATLIFIVGSIQHGLPADGPWKGNIHQWKPHYPGEGLAIIFAGIVGSFSFLGGVMLTIITLHEDFGVRTAFRKK